MLNYIPLSCVRNFACSSRLFYFIAISTVKKESFWCAQYHQRFGASYLHKPIRSWKSAYKDFHRGMRATGSHLVWIILPALINCTIRKDDLYKCLSCKDFISTITDVGQHETIQFILHRELDTLISAQLEKTHKKFRHYLSDHDHVVCNAKAFIKHFLSKRKKVHRSCQDFSEDFTQICDFIKTGWDTYFFFTAERVSCHRCWYLLFYTAFIFGSYTTPQVHMRPTSREYPWGVQRNTLHFKWIGKRNLYRERAHFTWHPPPPIIWTASQNLLPRRDQQSLRVCTLLSIWTNHSFGSGN